MKHYTYLKTMDKGGTKYNQTRPRKIQSINFKVIGMYLIKIRSKFEEMPVIKDLRHCIRNFVTVFTMISSLVICKT